MRNEISPEIRWLEMIARENINETEISYLCDAEDNKDTKREVEALILSFSTPSCISIYVLQHPAGGSSGGWSPHSGQC